MINPDEATKAQIRASSPTASTWLGANAGSGKTRVLTNRVARLLLQGVDPQQILCLTYTKAAATEMQNRLFERLGSWAMMSNEKLTKSLTELGEARVSSHIDLARARTLFARAIETPGGLKVQTIHSFCASILRRFSLEAGVNPSFKEMDDRASDLLRLDVLSDIAHGPQRARLETLMMHLGEDSLEDFCVEISQKRTLFFEKPHWERVAQSFDIDPKFSDKDLLAAAFLGDERDLVARLIPILEASTKTDQATARRLSEVKELDIAALRTASAIVLTKTGTVRVNLCSKKVKDTYPELIGEFQSFAERLLAAKELESAASNARQTYDIWNFAHTYLTAYETAKARLAYLDFDDLILRTQSLLSDQRVATWVLYRLDGGLTHILVDEAQDTSPEQWAVIRQLFEDYTSGESARSENEKTLFVVGDKKQSIYSFQGADPREFDTMRADFAQKLAHRGGGLKEEALAFSFRSSQAILEVVDRTFATSAQAGFTPNEAHLAFHRNKPGRVDLWPVIARQPDTDDRHWTDPVDRKPATHHTIILAETIADEIARMLDPENPVSLPGNGSDQAASAIQPHHIMILLQRRSGLFHNIIKACKDRNLPIAGSDRLKVAAELAVRDILAMVSVVLSPDDDLSLATCLKSPFFGWSEQDLFRLAHSRGKKSLWQALLETTDAPDEPVSVILDLRRQADFLRPFDLIERLLTRHQGRARLLSRLGPEAEDGIDALLSQAMSYETAHIPSLTGFLSWAQADDLEIKRSFDESGNKIRIMTVHGAKGLEAPIVILPDCAYRANTIRDHILSDESGPIFKPPADEQGTRALSALEQRKAQEDNERLRLLYVAMTRAETWLIVMAAGDLGKEQTSWFSRIEAGLSDCATQEIVVPTGHGLRYETGDWSCKSSVAEEPSKSTQKVALEPYFGEKHKRVDTRKKLISPSDLGGAKALPSRDGLETEHATIFGTYVHKLLELAADRDSDRLEIMLAKIQPPTDLPDDLVQLAQTTCRKVLQRHELAWIFSTDSYSEVPVQADIGAQKLRGTIDKLIVKDDAVIALDFKSNQGVPSSPKTCPEGILRQLGAYHFILSRIYPKKPIETGILWTSTQTYMAIPQHLVTAAFERAMALDEPRPDT